MKQHPLAFNPIKDAETQAELLNDPIKDAESEGKEKEPELGSGDDKEGGEDPNEAIATKDPELVEELIGTKDPEDTIKDPGGEEDLLNLFKGAALGAGKSFSAPRGQDFMYRLDFNPPEPLEVSITDEDYLAKLEQMSSSDMLDDIIKRNSGNSGGMLT